MLWFYRTTPRRATRELLFKMCFGVEAMIPAEVVVNSLRNEAFIEEINSQLMDESLVFRRNVSKSGTERITL